MLGHKLTSTLRPSFNLLLDLQPEGFNSAYRSLYSYSSQCVQANENLRIQGRALALPRVSISETTRAHSRLEVNICSWSNALNPT